MKNKKQNQNGFTLIEMVVVISLVIIISSIAVFQFSKQRKGIYLEATAEEISLAIRSAQTRALAVRSTGGLVPSYQNGYGIHFELGNPGNPQDAGEMSYVLFTDYEATPGIPGNWDRAYLRNFNPGAPCGSPQQTIDECVEKTNIATGDKITSLSVCSTSGGTPSCNAVLPGQGLDITFLRPNLDAYFCTISPGNGGCMGLVPTIGYAEIGLTSPIGTTKTVKVWSTGQISIE